METEHIWFGLAHIQAINSNKQLDDAAGAFVNVMYKATSQEEFIKLVEHTFKERDFDVIEIEDIERADNLTIDNPENAEKLVLLEDVQSGLYDFSWGNFYTY